VGLRLLNVGIVISVAPTILGQLVNPIEAAVSDMGSVREFVAGADTTSLGRVLKVGSVIEKEPVGLGLSGETPSEKGVISAIKDARRRLA
jgi:hypothetical protein